MTEIEAEDNQNHMRTQGPEAFETLETVAPCSSVREKIQNKYR